MYLYKYTVDIGRHTVCSMMYIYVYMYDLKLLIYIYIILLCIFVQRPS